MRLKRFARKPNISKTHIYRYNRPQVKPHYFVIAIIFIAITVASLAPNVQNPESARAVSDTARPDGDTTAGWANCTNSCAQHADEVDESTYDGNDYVSTGTGGGDGDTEQYTMTSVAGTTLNVTQVDVTVYAWINGACNGSGGNCDTLSVNISIDGSTTNSNEGAQTYTLGTTANDSQTFTFTPTTTWTGDDDLEVIVVRNVNGGGPGASRDDDVYMAYVDAVVTFDVNIDQEHFRWRNDTTALNTDGGGTDWLAAEDTKPASTDTRINDTLRLRVEIDNSGAAGTANVGYRLEWAIKGASCSASTGWTRIDTGSDAWEMTASAQYADGDSLSTSRLTGGEPTFVNGYGLDTDSSGDDESAAIQLDADDYTEIEWAIKANTNATEGESYCFRVVDSSGGALNAYNVYPEVTLYQTSHAAITQKAYIWENDDGANADSNTQQAAGDTALTGVKKGERLTLRTHIDNTGDRDTRDNFALFYDRNDGIWTKVQNSAAATSVGNCNEDNFFTCSGIDVTDDVGKDADIAIGLDGRPWIAYEDDTNNAFSVAQYVGSGGNGCLGGSTTWTCQLIISGDSNSYIGNAAIAIGDDDSVWFAAYNSGTSTVYVAEYVGSGGSACVSSDWNCEGVTTNLSAHFSLAIDSNGVTWISGYNVSSTQLQVISRNGGGSGNCNDNDWNCETVDNSGSDAVGEYTSIAISPTGIPYVSYYDGGSETNLMVARRDGGGSGNCTDTDWNCETVDATGDIGSYTSISFSPDAVPWVSYYDTTNTALKVAQRATSGFGATCNDSDWRCGTVDSTGTVGLHTSIAFDPSGSPWISYFDDDTTATNKALKYTRFVGSGGSGCTDAAWDGCGKIDSSGSDAIGEYSSLAFDNSGNAWISYYDGGTEGNLKVATVTRKGEISTSPAVAAVNGDSLSESHADMTTTVDTTNRDTADCMDGNTDGWNNGIFSTSEEIDGNGLLPSGETADQCTELAWEIDTSQAVEGETYRFVIASDDSFRADKGKWRGPIAIDSYPTLTVEADTDARYSKSILPTFSDCDNTDWGCMDIDTTNDVGTDTSIAFDSEGNAWISYYDVTNTALRVAEYVGSGGSGCADSAWNCTTVDSGGSNNRGLRSSIAFSPDGVPFIAYRDISGINNNLWIAEYVGSGGDCTSTAWSCYEVEDIYNNNTLFDISLAFNAAGNPAIAYFDHNTGTSTVAYAVYVGSGGDCTSTAWECTTLRGISSDFDATTLNLDLEFDSDGMPTISFTWSGAASDRGVDFATYVGTGGTCASSTAWTCERVDDPTNDVGRANSHIIYTDGNPWIAYGDVSASSLKIAEYTGTGTETTCDDDGTGKPNWDCTTIYTGNGPLEFTKIMLDTSGAPVVTFYDSTSGDLGWAKYVGSGGSGCDITSWSCETIATTNDVGNYSEVAIDPSGKLWASYYDTTGGDLGVAVIDLPETPLTTDRINFYSGSSDFRYRLDDLGYSDVLTDDSALDDNAAIVDQIPIYGFSKEFTSNGQSIYVSWTGKSTVSMGTNNGVLQIYNYSTNTWETLSTETSACTTTCTVTATSAGTTTDYYNAVGSEYEVNVRFYQNEHTSAQTLSTDEIIIEQNPPMAITQEGYIWEYDDGSSADTNSQQAAGDTAITDVRKGERLNLRTHLKNTGGVAPADYSLFYDRGDGLWSKVQNIAPDISAGNCTDSLWTCEEIDSSQINVGNASSIAIDKDGNPIIAYHDLTNSDLYVARFVGSGGDCDATAGSDAWSCELVASSTSQSISHIVQNADQSKTAVYYEGFGMYFAEYVGSGGDCDTLSGGSDAWECTQIDSGTISFEDIAYDPSDNIWASFRKSSALIVAEYVGDGSGSCTDTNWDCVTVDSTVADTGYRSQIIFDDSGKAHVFYVNSTDSSLMHAQYVGGGLGSGCTSSDWDCEVIEDDGTLYTTFKNLSVGIDPAGDFWVAYARSSGGNGSGVYTAKYVGSGGNCDAVSGSDAWQCTKIRSAAPYNVAIAFDPSGVPWVASGYSANESVMISRYVGSGGNCDTSYSGSDEWECSEIQDNSNNLSYGTLSLAFDGDGNAYLPYYDRGDGTCDTANECSLNLAYTTRQAEITLSPSLSASNGDTTAESHADMTTVGDTTNRDDIDCLTGGAVWNNGIHTTAEEIANYTLNKGDVTAQCTELSWSIDTSQAQENTSYRFVVATKDSWDPGKGAWRGPVAIDEYPTISIKTDTEIRYSKDSLPTFADCTDTDWGCLTIAATGTFATDTSLVFSPDGIPWISFYDTSTLSLKVAQYVGSGGSGCTGGSSAWNCQTIDDVGATGGVGKFASIAFDEAGKLWIAYYDDDSNAGDIKLAYQVDSGGIGCTGATNPTEWVCETIDGDTTDDGVGGLKLSFTPEGNPWIVYSDDTNDDIILAKYVGSGAGSGCGNSGSVDWSCSILDVSVANGGNEISDLVFDNNGTAWVSYYENNQLGVSRYVGSGGNCTDTAWQCEDVDISRNVGTSIDMVVDSSGKAYVFYRVDTATSGIFMAEYIGGGGGSGCDDTDWTCTQIDTDIGFELSAELDLNDKIWLSYDNQTGLDLKIATNSGREGSACTASGWTCGVIDSSVADTGEETDIAFDQNGTPWISYIDQTNDTLRVAKLHRPADQLSGSRIIANQPRSASTGDMTYRVYDGRSARTNDPGSCGSTLAAQMGICGIFDNQGDYDSMNAGANESPIYAGAVKFTTNTELPTIYWEGRTDVAPNTASSAGDLVLQVYRFGTTNAWETIASDTTSSDCNTVDCVLSGAATGTVSEYFEADGSEYWAYFRVYQEAHTTAINFKVDKFSAQITDQQLRGGRIFEDGVRKPLVTE